ncbi:hypothetical protein BsWGS_26319 [Bradybaena similaris]
MSNQTESTEKLVYKSIRLETVLLMVMLTLFSVVGSVGNGLVVFVFQGIREKSPSQVFIISMAVIDLLTCMVVIPLVIYKKYKNEDIKYDFLCKLYHFLLSSKIPMSVFIMVAIAFDRYFCICHPLKRIITVFRARVIVVCLAFIASLLGIVRSLCYGVYQVRERYDFKRIDEIAGTNFTKHAERIDSQQFQPNPYDDLHDLVDSDLRSMNFSFNETGQNGVPVITEIIYVGTCRRSEIIFGARLYDAYLPVFTVVYPCSLVTIIIIYLMIYRSICLRRSKMLQQKLTLCSYVDGDGAYQNTRLVSGETDELHGNSKNKTTPTVDNPGLFPTSVSGSNGGLTSASSLQGSPEENTVLGTINAQESKTSENVLNNTTTRNNISSSPTNTTITTNMLTPLDNVDGKSKRERSPCSSHADQLREENRAANVRTALMLFTVTLVFMIAFVPAWIMAHSFTPFIAPVFFMHFIYHVANPFIYAFMNPVFKDHMHKVLTCRY